MFTIEMVTSGERTLFVLRAEEATQTWLDQAHQRCAVQAPQYLPMVVPPRAWTNPFNGGYLDRKGLPLRMLTGRRINRNYLEELRTRPMPMVYEALNAVQATPWRINTRVLDVLRTLWDAGSSAAGLPSRDPLPIPVAPWGEGLEAPNEDAHKDHMAARGRAYEANYAMISRRRSLQAKLWVAEEFQQYEAIYFPHVLDWRGRLYPVPTHVNPQADDTGRAVLEFANGAPLGETGGFWLAVHGANCFGVDKVTFQARADWVQENQAQIVACAADPLASTWWHDAEDPFLFLAFVFEWADFVKHVSSGATQADFVSSIPVSWDGSCNGLQNFSAMLRDPIGGAATNLVPSSTPADIYQAVADVASAQVERDAVQGEVNAVYWRGTVTRKLAKRPTMTLPYGSGRYGFRDQIREELTKLKLANNKPYIEGDEFLCSLYLANVLHEALGKVVVAAVHAMDWLREASQVAAKQGLPVWWSTPAGFLAQQEYRDTIGQMVNLTLNGRRIRMTLEVEGTKLDARKQAQGISPNFVHSLDAAHLMRTVAKAHALGLRSFAMVHDSYGTHAGNAGLLHGVLREAFVEQYSTDVLTTFRDELIQQLPEEKRSEVPPVPTLGTLDLNDVLKSDYFFA
jgi:DNA-directed RNA polymerase